jgi:hypothetical protein
MDEEIKSHHDTSPPPEMNTHDMVYFAIHRPLRISSSDHQLIQDLEFDTVCYAIIDSNEGINPSASSPSSSSNVQSSDRVVTQLTAVELPDMMNRYPNAIYYILQHPTWAEPEQLQDLLDEYPDSVVYYVPRPSYLPRLEPDHQESNINPDTYPEGSDLD